MIYVVCVTLVTAKRQNSCIVRIRARVSRLYDGFPRARLLHTVGLLVCLECLVSLVSLEYLVSLVLLEYLVSLVSLVPLEYLVPLENL